MKYTLEISSGARRALNRLPMEIASAIAALLVQLEVNPHRVGHELHEPWKGYHSARRGPYRVLYRINDERVQVIVARIGHRADVYRGR